ncbi:hypothetical protein LCGC14_2005980 [marine sediment metagenome]|uniref:Uncharacterized protein n=1 Tax=marine sediment metagenome TaxID=412755 RepID=A0A0F9FPF3_9ZZZZ
MIKLIKENIKKFLIIIGFLAVASAAPIIIPEQTIEQQLQGKNTFEKAQIKANEIAKLNLSGEYISTEYGVKIEIIGDVKEIDGGIELFARAWRGNKQFGFGKDGIVEIERFLIYNPPILVPDDNGDIVREWQDNETGELMQKRYREDLPEAIRQVIAHNVTLLGKEDTQIIKGKVGNTTSTFYSTTADGTFLSDDKATYTLARDAAAASSIDQGNGNVVHNSSLAGTFFVRRHIGYFDTSALGTDTINSATYSVANRDTDSVTDDSDSIIIVEFTGSNPPIVGDLDLFGSTSGGSLAISSFETVDGTYTNIDFNATGEGFINKSGVSDLGLRTQKDIDNTQPSGANYLRIYVADEAGTTKDPKLVVVHSAVSAEEVSNSQGYII